MLLEFHLTRMPDLSLLAGGTGASPCWRWRGNLLKLIYAQVIAYLNPCCSAASPFRIIRTSLPAALAGRTYTSVRPSGWT